ncbi:MAG: 50S ribosomal protein L11 methyltransferase [Christensenellaceae bacterium]
MKYIELTVTTTNLCEELVSDIFWKYTDYGVAISNVLDVAKILQGEVIYDYYDKEILNGAKGVSLVKGYFSVDEADEKIALVRKDLDALKNESVFDTGTLETVKREIDGDDWLSIWKKHFKPIIFGGVTICPEWINCENLSGTVVKINSDMAFGTGEHETTSMILSAMQSYIKKGQSVLDVGTGSGILGITAALIGAQKVLMTDIDRTACLVAQKNIKLNDVERICFVECRGDLENVEERFDVVVANITAEVLTFLSDSISKVVKPGGIVILSGILKDRLDKVETTFSRLNLSKLSSDTQGEWSSLILIKK